MSRKPSGLENFTSIMTSSSCTNLSRESKNKPKMLNLQSKINSKSSKGWFQSWTHSKLKHKSWTTWFPKIIKHWTISRRINNSSILSMMRRETGNLSQEKFLKANKWCSWHKISVAWVSRICSTNRAWTSSSDSSLKICLKSLSTQRKTTFVRFKISMIRKMKFKQ